MLALEFDSSNIIGPTALQKEVRLKCIVKERMTENPAETYYYYYYCYYH